ncbi:MAG TPA: phosphorylase [Terriglobales bacterium]|nr:phosphorylase [Terriglobales bacterium]
MPNPAKVAIIAALEREVRPLIRQWKAVEREYDGRRYKFFENDRAVLVCGGIGPEAARRATEAAIQLYAPIMVQSVGFAGALDSTLKAGTVLTPICVIDAKDGSRVEAGVGHWVVVSVDHTASAEQKAKLAKAYWAHAVDMEAAAVARAAQARGITFVGLKAISDEADFEMPSLDQFVASDGRFRTAAFAAFVLVRPWLWRRVMHLASNSRRAANGICEWLEQYNRDSEELVNSEQGLHPIPERRD